MFDSQNRHDWCAITSCMDVEEKIKESFAGVADKYVRRVFENLTEEEIKEAAQNFEEYLSAVWDIASRKVDQVDQEEQSLLA